MTTVRRTLAVVAATVGVGIAVAAGATSAYAGGEEPVNPETAQSDGVGVPKPGRT